MRLFKEANDRYPATNQQAADHVAQLADLMALRGVPGCDTGSGTCRNAIAIYIDTSRSLDPHQKRIMRHALRDLPMHIAKRAKVLKRASVEEYARWIGVSPITSTQERGFLTLLLHSERTQCHLLTRAERDRSQRVLDFLGSDLGEDTPDANGITPASPDGI